MTCDYAQWDAAYVLGALSPTERVEFQQHLSGCRQCTRSVQEIAGLPGLLARVPVDVLEEPPAHEPAPDTLLPRLVREVRRTRRRRFVTTVSVAAAAAAAAAAGGVGVGLGVGGGGTVTAAHAPGAGSSPSATAPAGRAMVPVGASVDMSARVAMATVPWGTRLDLTCSYARLWQHGHQHASSRYALVVRTNEGTLEQVATWNALPGKTMHLTAASATPRSDIAAVEVRTADGKPLLRLLS